jgi:hypothetical protein
MPSTGAECVMNGYLSPGSDELTPSWAEAAALSCVVLWREGNLQGRRFNQLDHRSRRIPRSESPSSLSQQALRLGGNSLSSVTTT